MDKAPTHLDLFSGIGGFALAAQWAGFRTVAFVEIDKYCRKVLTKNFLADTSRTQLCSTGSGNDSERRQTIGLSCGSPQIFGDIFDLDGTAYRGVSLITGGFPCQPFSVAGKRGGAADDRALWPEMFRVIREARPAWVLGENVSGIIPMELDNVLSDLEGIRYATRAFVIPACTVDARHRRDRVWIVGKFIPHTTISRGQSGQGKPINAEHPAPSGNREATQFVDGGQPCIWEPEPAICELADGLPAGLVRYAGRVATKVPNRVQKLKGLGNSIVPQVAYEILLQIRNLI